MDRINDYLRLSHCSWIERRPPPRHIHRQSGVVHNTTVSAVATQVVRTTHKDAIHGTGFDAKCAKHALRVVDRVARDLESFAAINLFLANVDAIHRTSLGTLIASDASCQIKAMETTVPRHHWYGLLRVLKPFRKRPPIILVRSQPIPQSDVEPLDNRAYGDEQIAKPSDHIAIQSNLEGTSDASGTRIIELARWAATDRHPLVFICPSWRQRIGNPRATRSLSSLDQAAL